MRKLLTGTINILHHRIYERPETSNIGQSGVETTLLSLLLKKELPQQ